MKAKRTESVEIIVNASDVLELLRAAGWKLPDGTRVDFIAHYSDEPGYVRVSHSVETPE